MMDKTFEERINKLKAGVDGLLDRISDTEPNFRGKVAVLNYVKELIDITFPELKESKDERIRKEIYNFLIDMECKKEWIAYLEKQKEQKPSTEETELNSIAFLEQMGYTCIPPKEQQPIAHEKDFVSKPKNSVEILKHYLTWATSEEENCPYSWKELADAIRNGIKALEEQKPTAEEVLIKAGLKPFKDGNQWCVLAGDNIQEGVCGFGDTIEDALYDFLISVLDLQKEQKHAEWSEEDEEMFACIIDDVKEINKTKKYKHQKEIGEMEINWLKNRFKSLRPQPHWKPSEEQMEALGKVSPEMLLPHERVAFHSLYNDLKKLI